MHILMIANGMGIGGAETHIIELSSRLLDKGHTLTVASSKGIYTNELSKRGINTLFIPYFNGHFSSFCYQLFSLFKICREINPDVLHGHARPCCLAAIIIGKILSIPVVSTAHLPFEKKNLLQRFTRWGDQVLVVSDDIGKHLIDQYHIPQENIIQTLNGIDIKTFYPQGFQKENIVHVSRLDKDRSETAKILIEIAPEIEKTKCCQNIIIVGHGDQFLSLKKKADSANRTIGYDFIRLTGQSSHVHDFLKGSPLFIGVSRAALEAMSCECPIILSGNEGYSGIITLNTIEKEAQTNFCCRHQDKIEPEILLNDIKTVFSLSDAERKKLGKELRAYVQGTFNTERMAQDAEFAYRKARSKKENGIFLCGYYGYGNLGDETCLPVLLKRYRRDYDHIVVMCHMPKVYQKKYQVYCIGRYSIIKFIKSFKKGDTLVLGGGNLLQNQTSNRSLAYYLFMCQMARLLKGEIKISRGGIGTLQDKKSELFTSKILSKISESSLRTPSDLKDAKALLRQKKLKFEADASLLIKLKEVDEIQNKKRYCTIVLHPMVNKKRTSRFINRFCAVHKCFPVFLIFHPQKDTVVTNSMASKIQNSKIIIPQNVEQAYEIIKNGICTITCRLHAGYFSLIANRPCVLIGNDKKTKYHYQYIRACIKRAGVNKQGVLLSRKEILQENIFNKKCSTGENSRLIATMVGGGRRL